MNEQFSNVGVSRMETYMMSLSASDRRMETDYLRANPVEWIEEHFELSPSQIQQLQAMNSDLLTRIAYAVAESWDQGQLITFYKETQSTVQKDEEKKSPKEIIFSNQKTQTMAFGEEPSPSVDQVGIWIRYK